MSFIYRDRNDDDYFMGFTWMRTSRHIPQCDRSVYDCIKEEMRDEKENNNLENFYASGL